MHHVIVGQGPAGVVAAEALNKLDPDAEISLVGDEPEPVPAAEIGAPQMEWRSSDFPCEMVRIGRDGVAFGACGSEALLGGPALSGPRGELMQNLLGALAPFAAETPAGFVEFFGGGARAATPAEQRQLAELARLVLADAGSGSEGAAALTWRRDALIDCTHSSLAATRLSSLALSSSKRLRASATRSTSAWLRLPLAIRRSRSPRLVTPTLKSPSVARITRLTPPSTRFSSAIR